MDKNKSIDGLAFKRDKKSEETTIDGIAPKKKSGEKPAKAKATKIIVEEVTEPKKAKSEDVAVPKDYNIESAAEDFLKPVSTLDFDAKSGKLTESDKPIKKAKPNKDMKKEAKSEKKLEKKLAKQEKRNAKNSKKLGKKKSKVKTVIVTIILSLVALVLAAGCWLCIWGNDIIAKITGGKGNIIDALVTIFDENYEPLKKDANGRTNIVVFGTSGYDMDGNEGNGTHDGAQLTDSIMVVSIDQEAGDVALLSLPRDLKVFYRCTATGKINEVYFCKSHYGENEEAGATALMNELNTILGVEMHYYVHINWGSLVQIVDTLGGITITLDEDVNDIYWTGAKYQAGIPYTIDGMQALALARARHGTIGGDFSRGNSQQKILLGIRDRIYEKNVSFVDMLSLFSALGDNLRTNLSLSEIKTGVHLTFEFDFDKIRQILLVDYNKNVYYLTTANINGISYVIPRAGEGNYSAIKQYVAEQFKTPVPPEPEPEPEAEAESDTTEE